MADLRFIVLTRPVDGREDAYNEWYETTHLPELLALPGFTAAQRFKLARQGAGPGGPAPAEYLAVYEVEGTAEAAEAALLAGIESGAVGLTDALAPAAAQWWFESVGERQEA
jgi:hypothetical protein